jgi:hypothetical protein
MMRVLFVAAMLCLFAVGAWAADEPVNGYLHEVDGQPILHVWGTPEEMGFAHGYFLGPDIVAVFRGYVLEMLPPALYEILRDAVLVFFSMPDNYRAEARAMIEGMIAAGADPYVPELRRDLDDADLLVGNSLGDVGAMGCSAQLAWGGATAGDPELAGETALVHNLDWKLAGPDLYLLPKKTILLVYTPTEDDRRTVAMVSFPGFFGCLSCMNADGVAAVLNIGHNGVPLWENDFSPGYYPIGFTMREALHEADYNGDGAMNLNDVVDAVERCHRSGASIINLAQPQDLSEGDPAVILEADNLGAVLRTPADESNWYDNILLATNDLLKLRPGEPCDRYEKMKQETKALGGHLTLDEMWEIADSVMQESWLTTTAQTMTFLPAKREMRVAFSDNNTFSCEKEPAVLSWSALTELPDGVELDDDTEPQNEDSADDDSACCG